MVQMREIAYEDFILIEADHEVTQAVAVVQKLGVTAIVVRRWQGARADYYLYLAQDFLDRLAEADSGQPLAETLDLRDAEATPTATPIEDRSTSVQQEISAYQEALRYWTPDAAPLEYAQTQYNLGLVYQILPTGDRSANLQQAISCFLEALRYWTPDAAPLEYAQTQYNLGLAYQSLPTGDRSTNLQRGKALQEQALKVLQKVLRFPTPVVEAYEDAETAPERCVIIDNDRVIGFYDVTVAPASVKRGDGHGTQAAETAVARALQTTFPEQVALGHTASMLVSLVKLDRPAEGPTALPFVVLPSAEVEIMVEALDGFVVEGTDKETLTVIDEDETLPLKFELRATDVGPGRIRILVFRHAQPLGGIILTPMVLPVEQFAAGQRVSSPKLLTPFTDRDPDLTLRIIEHREAGRNKITFELSAQDRSLGLRFKPYGPIELRLDPQQYFREFFRDIELLSIKTAEEREIAMRKLELRGAHLFEELIPDTLRTFLWSLRKRIDTLQVLSDEPWIPWELLRLVGEQDGQVEEGLPLCEAFAMTRWFPGVGLYPRFSLSHMAVVVPTNSGLQFAQQERDYLGSLATAQRQVIDIPARFQDVIEALSAGIHDSWHYCGHAKFGEHNPDASAILLENSRFTAGELSGRVRNVGRARPLIFLNGCQTGQEALSLTGIGGWAKKFVDAGAAGFVGSLWSVRDKAAYEFAKAFYGHLLVGQPIGQAVREARKVIKPHNDTTWLAYTVFADPLATVQR